VSRQQLLYSLAWSFGVTAVAAALARVLPPDYGATAVALCFAGAAYGLVLRQDRATIEHFGCALGGILLPAAIEWHKLALRALKAVGWCALCALLCFPPYWFLYLQLWHPPSNFHWAAPSFDALLGHLFAVALPEELFFRGYCQTALDDAFERRIWVFGARLGPGVALASVVFAIGHILADPLPGRLSVFFPSLVFGWLRARTGGVGAPILFHTSCNLLAATLTAGYFER
jgi:uncharacterized protein